MSGETKIAVSDHALVRWLDRTGLIDLQPIRTAIAASIGRAADAAASIEADEYLILADGLVYVVRNRVLVTVLEEDGRHSHVRMLAAKDRD